jgi:hypothetical protein
MELCSLVDCMISAEHRRESERREMPLHARGSDVAGGPMFVGLKLLKLEAGLSCGININKRENR